MRTYVRRGLAVAAVALTLCASACGKANQASGNGSDNVSVNDGFKVGVLLPESKTARYEKFDRPYLEADIAKACPKCTVEYRNANQNANTQRQQVDSVLAAGVKVIIVDSVNYKSIQSSVKKAKQQGVPVIAYDRLATGPIAGYSSFDNEKIGELQGQAFLTAISKGGNPKRGKVILVNGSPDDPNAPDFKKGMHKVLDGKVNVGAEYDTTDWSPDGARQEVGGAISKIGAKNVLGVYAANDGMAGGAIAALKSANVTPLPPVTGQDSELAGIQRILKGEQYATIYKSIKPQAQAAAEMAVAAAQGKKWTGGSATVNNGTVTVPAKIVSAQTVTKENIQSTVVDDGYWKVSEICTATYAAACTAAGVK
ncbi:substrate-binding domain-containing protein [Actinopolymorpha pittospori]|uniref:D-xylose transport system substrate-binding protein n=1 Tax=Actinopolymorpha pittospori TaxID=648752 RepID=A0A927RMP9_9ACTN|nr:D-xylose transport system substrate-binding protein [Actinopolymorpha pittospori]